MAEESAEVGDARWQPAIRAALTLLPEWDAVQAAWQRKLRSMFDAPENLDELIDEVWEYVQPTNDYLGRLGQFIERALSAVEHMPGPLVEGDRLTLWSTITAGMLHDMASKPPVLAGLVPFLGPLGLAAARHEAHCHTTRVETWIDWSGAGTGFRDEQPERWSDYLPSHET